MRQIRISKRHQSGAWRLDLLSQNPMPMDPRDPDIVLAKKLDRRAARACERPARNGRPKSA